MNRSLRLLAMLWLGAAALVAGPVTLTWSAQEAGSALCLANGSPLAVGQTIRLGYFDLSSDEVRNQFTEPSLLASHFTLLAEAIIGSFETQTFVGYPALSTAGLSFPEATGCFAASVVLTPAVDVSGLQGQRCYVWAMNGSTVETSTEHGIFSDASWALDLNGFGAMQWDLSQVSAFDPGDVLLGHRGPQISAQAGGTVLRLANTLQLHHDAVDDDHDGVVGLLEDAFGMDSTQPDSRKLPQITVRNGKPCLEFQRLSGGAALADDSYLADGLLYQVEISDNLKDWRAYHPASLTLYPGAAPNTELASIVLASGTSTTECRFARVRVERVP